MIFFFVRGRCVCCLCGDIFDRLHGNLLLVVMCFNSNVQGVILHQARSNASASSVETSSRPVLFGLL